MFGFSDFRCFNGEFNIDFRVQVEAQYSLKHFTCPEIFTVEKFDGVKNKIAASYKNKMTDKLKEIEFYF